jgi:hypothetical protein
LGPTASKPPGRIIIINKSEILSSIQVRFITLFFGGAQLVATFTSHGKVQEFGAEKTNFLS